MTRSASRTRLAALGLAALALLAGCSSKQSQLELEARGPEFLVEGRLSLRRVGKPTLIGSFQWGRGNGVDGWIERIELTDSSGVSRFIVESNSAGVVVTDRLRRRKVESLEWLLADQLGVQVKPATLASWLAGQGELAGRDRLLLDDTQVEVIVRGKQGRPARLRIVQQDTILLLAIRSYT